MRQAMGAVVLAAVTTALVPSIHGQDARPYEVASVKRHPPDDDGPWNIQALPGGPLHLINMPLATMIAIANQVQKYQVDGGPSWAASDGYDVIVKPVEGVRVNADTMRPMLRAMLEERFHLRIRHETRQLPVYALVPLHAGRLGPHLQHAALDCTGRSGPPVAAGATPTDAQRRCGVSLRAGLITVNGFPLSTLATMLAPLVTRTVVDRTALDGNWDLQVEFTPEPFGAAPGPNTAPVPSDAPSLFTALQEQLGLKLEASRGPVDVLVIDSVTRPADD